MKSSNIEWIGQIPENWNVCRNKNIMKKVKDICFHYKNEDILSLTMNGVIKRNLDNPTGKMPATFDGYQYVKKDNLLLCLFDIDVTPRCVGLIKDDGLTSPAYSQFELFEDNYNAYYDYLLRYIDDTKQFLHLSKNLRSSLTEDDFGMIGTVKPPVEEQKKIVKILDKKCAEIDELIALQEKEIEKLKEYKQSVITEIVTKGLDKNAKMKDSGNSFIGYIPESYRVLKIKQVCSERISDGTHSTPTYTSKEEGYPFLSSKDVRNGYIDTSDIKFITLDTHNEIAKEITPQKGDVLLSKNGSIGFSAVVDTDFNFDIYVTLALLRPNNLILSKYLKYALDCITTQNQFNLHLLGIGVPNLHLNVIQDTKIIVPYIEEQKEIIKYLDKYCKYISDLMKMKQKKIIKLQDYKKSLIYEYVTGKRSAK